MRFLRALFNFAAGQYEDSKGQSLILNNPVKRLSQTRAWYPVKRRQTVIKSHELELWFQATMNLKNDGISQNRETIRDYLLLILFTGPRKQMAKIIEQSGVTFTIHDLRRTFMTIAESLDISAYAVKRLANHKMNNDITAGYIVADTERLRKPMQKITDYILKCAGYKPTATITAKILGVSVAFLERDRWAGARAPFIKIGSRAVRYRYSDLLAYIDSCSFHSTSQY
ncbi:hypothetical protein [Nitrosomonas sp.]|uniref:hypothetical protein n=1 Tax=Nitrosomonas sp. TaxID=42353 RepID=UPI0025F9B5B0|nr:hypothetical protein [Nitrosomonas sp.]